MATNALKWLIGMLLLGNLGIAGYNGMVAWERLDYDQTLTHVADRVVAVRNQRQALKDTIARIRRQNIVAIDYMNVYLSERATACSMKPESQLQIGTKSEKNRIGGNRVEERWKVGFNTKEHVFSLRTIAAYCQAIESGSPQLQIKEVDLGKRLDVWGKDEWKPNSIVVRRITLQSKAGKTGP